ERRTGPQSIHSGGTRGLQVAVGASPHAVAPSGMHAHGRRGPTASPPHRSPGGHVPLQNGTATEPHGWLPSGTQPQKGNSSCTKEHVSPLGHVPPQLPGPPPQTGPRPAPSGGPPPPG